MTSWPSGLRRWIAFLHGGHRAVPAGHLLVAELRGIAAEPDVQALLRAWRRFEARSRLRVVSSTPGTSTHQERP